jgi:hypothetical protein
VRSNVPQYRASDGAEDFVAVVGIRKHVNTKLMLGAVAEIFPRTTVLMFEFDPAVIKRQGWDWYANQVVKHLPK